ncbi:hypothetical protein ABMA28_000092 [Loxostege sticticalis]|uniref:Uncharacterized protein n=1 Tax=Loxostege sticticalis TaxID=481309 RepID=A0ABD0TRB1_LOXSC
MFVLCGDRTRDLCVVAHFSTTAPNRSSVSVIAQKSSFMPEKCTVLEWMWTLTGQNREGARVKRDHMSELQIMLPPPPPIMANSGDVCLLAESPYRILRVNYAFRTIILSHWTVQSYHHFQTACTIR